MSSGGGLFHTPPPLDQSRSYLVEQSEMESYGTAAAAPTQEAQPNVSIKVNGSSNTPTTSSTASSISSSASSTSDMETEKKMADGSKTKSANKEATQESDDDEQEINLPLRLDRQVDRFIQSLKEPRYSSPLTADDIAALYQNFYVEFQTKAEVYLKEGLNRGSKDFQPLETYDEIAEKKRERNKRLVRLKQFIEDAEAKACITVYDKIFHLPFSGEDEKLNEQIMNRVKLLRQIPITLKHLDFNEVEEKDIVPVLGRAGESFHRMNQSKTPKRKLEHLLKAHKIIVSGLTDILPKGTTSADSIFPALIYTFIYFDTPNLWLNLQFITRFRNSKALKGEHMYCLTNFEAAVRFLQSVTPETLHIDPSTLPEDLDLTPLVDLSTASSTSTPPTTAPSTPADPLRSVSPDRERPRSRSFLDKRRLSMLHPTDIADQSLKSLGSTLNSSYKFFLGKIGAQNDYGKEKEYPNTLEDARKAVGLDSPSNASSSGLAIPRNASEESISVKSDSSPRQRQRSLSSQQPQQSQPSQASQQSQQQPQQQTSTFMNRLGGSMFRGFRAGSEDTTTSSPGASASANASAKLAAPLEHVLSADCESLTISDIRALHTDYKRMVEYLKSIDAFE